MKILSTYIKVILIYKHINRITCMLPESARKSCIISHSAITRTAHTFSKYNSKPLLLESSCCSLNLFQKLHYLLYIYIR